MPNYRTKRQSLKGKWKINVKRKRALRGQIEKAALREKWINSERYFWPSIKKTEGCRGKP